MIPLQTETSGFAKDVAKCSRCSGLLTRYDYGTDELGRTVENCPACGPMLLVRRVGSPLPRIKAVPARRSLPGCADCGGPMAYRGAGMKPVRCTTCQVERTRLGHLKRCQEIRERRRVVR